MRWITAGSPAGPAYCVVAGGNPPRSRFTHTNRDRITRAPFSLPCDDAPPEISWGAGRRRLVCGACVALAPRAAAAKSDREITHSWGQPRHLPLHG